MKLVSAVTFAFVAIANARPDVSHIPSGSYLPINSQQGYHQSGYPGNLGGIGLGGGQSQDQKHVYFYAAPNDEQVTRLRVIVEPKSQRNSKIIFIKSPSHGGIIPEIVAPPSSSEDRTLVYVLVKRPQDGQSVTVPAGLGVKQHKPQVFFIKYNNKQEAQHQINGGIQGQQIGINIPDVQSEHAFVNALGNGHGGSGAVDHGSAGVSTHFEISDNANNHGPTGISGPY
ncbi:hypothetical protein FQA39_LY00964 [Lamprigera yunnana]|nr:hypothetical protein FQA39_LY00964 [Lamprigera yunnana]